MRLCANVKETEDRLASEGCQKPLYASDCSKKMRNEKRKEKQTNEIRMRRMHLKDMCEIASVFFVFPFDID